MLKLGYARVSTDEQESHPKRDALAALGVAPERIYVAHGVTGTNQHRPGSSAVAAADCAGYPPSSAPERAGTFADEGPTRLSP